EACAFRYRPATAVDVYYNPARPDESVLEPGTPLRNWAMLAVGFLLIIAGFAIPG
ncbi:MAG: DUF3592 domain-containing protein, partial [Gemmatimonadetes bacterium]|nr:DUF3592 domain-containing protein [Gemmatimonadota bacterium]